MDHAPRCPACGITWLGQEIPDGLMAHNPDRYPTRDEAERVAGFYGWTPDNHRKFGINVIGMEIQGQYDGVSYWKCTNCESWVDRFTGEIQYGPGVDL